jgi:hypothetical protein
VFLKCILLDIVASCILCSRFLIIFLRHYIYVHFGISLLHTNWILMFVFYGSELYVFLKATSLDFGGKSKVDSQFCFYSSVHCSVLIIYCYLYSPDLYFFLNITGLLSRCMAEKWFHNFIWEINSLQEQSSYKFSSPVDINHKEKRYKEVYNRDT